LQSSTIGFGDTTKTVTMTHNEDSDRLLTKVDISKVAGLVEYSQSIHYDDLKRIKGFDITSGDTIHSKQYSYLTKGNHTTSYINLERHTANGKADNTRYIYDMSGNITQVIERNIPVIRYAYDTLSRLIREDNKIYKTTDYTNGKSTVFMYDIGGNITDKYEIAYTLDDIDLSLAAHIPYTYRLDGWKDQLLSYDGGELFEYDDLGNPEVYNGKKARWSHGRQLDSFDGTAFTYNADGIRKSKTHGNVVSNYILSGTKVLAEERVTTTIAGATTDTSTALIEYHYGADGIMGMSYAGTNFIYRKNISGDITHIFDTDGVLYAQYIYDAWGNHKVFAVVGENTIDITDNLDYTDISGNIHIAHTNPFRYRGYYFDTETSLYYLNTRYYDPTVGRFINADEITILDETQSQIHGLNLYMYCGNNPVMNIDPSGRSWWNPFSWDWAAIGAAIVVVAAVVGIAALTIFTSGVGTAALIAVASGIGIGATVGGVKSAINGTSIAGGIFGGAITGGAIGAAVGLGIITGGGGLAALGSVGAKIAVGVGALAGAAGINFVAGMASYATTNVLNNKSVNWKHALINGGLQSVAGAGAFIAGALSGAIGSYTALDLTEIVSLKLVDFIFSFPGIFATNILKKHFGG